MVNQYSGKVFPLVIVFLWVVIFQSCQSPMPSKLAYLGGIQVNEPDHKEWVSTLKEIGMNTVSVTVYVRQGIWNSDNLWWEENEPYVIKEIETAKAQGMKVVLIPRVMMDHYFDENDFLWHGMTMPRSDSLLTSWFKWFTVFVDHWAAIAEKYDVDVLAVGSEMRSLSATRPISGVPELESFYLNPEKQATYIADRMAFSEQIPPEDLWVRGKEVNYQSLKKYLEDEVTAKVNWAKKVACYNYNDPIAAINRRRAFILQHWVSLIKKIRGTYSGQLTYAANFDNYQEVAFWDQLDFIGINAYFKLREIRPDQSRIKQYEEIQDSWNRIFKNIATFRKTENLDQPVMFTELGYVYRENCTVMPWEGFGFSIAESMGRKNLLVWSKQKYNLEERAMAVKALRLANEKYGFLKGILYWKLTTKDYHIPYEPFVLHLKKAEVDPLQRELLEFL